MRSPDSPIDEETIEFKALEEKNHHSRKPSKEFLSMGTFGVNSRINSNSKSPKIRKAIQSTTQKSNEDLLPMKISENLYNDYFIR